MYKFFIALFLLHLSVSASAQQDNAFRKISGVVQDSLTHYTMTGVTVAVFKTIDTSYIDAQLTDNRGAFSLNKIPINQNVDLYITYSGYAPFRKHIIADSNNTSFDLGIIRLAKSYEELEEVVIVAPPVRMNGDTLEINPASFRLGPNAVVEDLLRRVNGIVVWGDGTITVNGKKVDNVYVDGKPFLSNSAKIATQNLPKNIIQKVQIYGERSGSPDQTGFGIADSLLTMNIKLKKGSKNGYLGKIEIAGGTSKKYEYNTSNILFTEFSRFALVAGVNNINKKISSISSALENGTYKNPNPNLSNAPDFEMDGSNTSGFYGLAFQHSFKPKRRVFLANDINADLIIHQNKSLVASDIISTALVSDLKQISHHQLISESRNNEALGNVSYRKQTKNTDFLLSADLNFSQQDFENNSMVELTEEKILKSTSNLVNNSDFKRGKMGIHGKYYFVDEKNLGLKSYFISIDVSHVNEKKYRTVQNDFSSFVSDVPDIFLNRRYNTENDEKNGKVNATYFGLKRLLLGNRDIPGLDLSLNTMFNLTNETSNNMVNDFDTVTSGYIMNHGLTYINNADTFQNVSSLNIEKVFLKSLEGRFHRSYKIEIKLKENVLALNNSSDISERNLNRRYNFFEPEITFLFNHINKEREITISYRNYITHKPPGIDMLFPVVDNIDLYTINHGNPFLKTENIFSNEIFIEYRKVRRGSNKSISASLKAVFSKTHNAITDSIIYDDAGKRMIYRVNVPFKNILKSTLSAAYSTKIRNQLLQFRYVGDYNVAAIPGYINSTYAVSNYFTLNHNFSVTYSVSEIITVDLTQLVSFSSVRLSSEKNTDLRNNLYITGVNANLNISPRCILSNSTQYVHNTYSQKQFVLWNMNLTYRFLKKEQLELKLSAFDILKKYKNIDTEVGYNYNLTKTSTGLQQFFMAGISFYPRAFGKKIKK